MQPSAAGGEMVELLGVLSPIAPTPRSSRPKRSVSTSGMQTRRRKATIEATSADEGEGVPEKKKKKKKRQRRTQVAVILG